jgi:1,4-dihydroxy-2-naphthoate octaprenyltransferase
LGAAIFLVRGWFVFWLAALTGVLGLSYSGWPLRFSYHGMGEILIGIIFGPLLMTGVYYAACGAFDPATLFISAPVGLLVMNIVYVHAIMDCAPDRACGKRTLAVVLGSGRRMLGGLLALLVGAFGLVVGGVADGRLSAWYLLTLLTLPMAGGLFYLMREFVLRPDRRFRPQLWMGPMGDWKRTEEVGLDWFRLRWQLARNLLVFFCLAIIAATLLSA